MSVHTNGTLARDLRDLAEMLLDHPVAGPIIRDAGVRRDFTDEEEKTVLEIATNAPMMAMFHEYRKERVRYGAIGEKYNPLVAAGLARQIADGLISSVDAPEAADLIERNMVPLNPDHPSFDERHEKKISFELFYKILCEYMNTPGLKQLRDAWFNYRGGSGGEKRELRTAFEAPAIRHLQRYGEIGLVFFADVANLIFLKGIDFNDRAAIWKIVTRDLHIEPVGKRDFGIDLRGAM